MPKISLTPATRGTYTENMLVSADEFGRPNVNPPDIVVQDNLTLYSFTLNTDRIFYKWQIPPDYAGGDVHIEVMWTNDGGVDDNGKNAKWQVDYQGASEGEIVSGSHANSPKTAEDTYASATGWILYHAPNMTIAEADILGEHMLFTKISAITPAGTALTCEPHLIGLHIIYRSIWGRQD